MIFKHTKEIILILGLLLIISSCNQAGISDYKEDSSLEADDIPEEATDLEIGDSTEEIDLPEEDEDSPIEEEITEEVIEEEPEIEEAVENSPKPKVLAPDLKPTANGKTYYVSTSGDNSNPGTRESPWATPGFGSRQLQPGDTLLILGGRYILSEFDADIITPNSGVANNWVVIRGEEGNRPVLAGRDNLLSGFNIADAHYAWIDNLEITSDNGAQFRNGIEGVSGLVNHVILSNLYIHNVDEYGINIADTDDLKILDSQIVYTGYGSVGGPEGQQGGWRNVLIRGSSLSYNGHYYQGGPGPSPYDRPDGFGIEPSDGPIEIVDTIAEHNRGDGFDSKARNTYIHDCTVSNNFADGIKLWGTGSKVENCLIYGKGDGNAMSTPWASIVIDTTDNNAHFELADNTIDAEAGQSYLMYVQYDFGDVPITLVMKNNIFSSRGDNSPIYLNRLVSYTAENNAFWFPGTDHVLEHSGVRQFGSNDMAQLGSGSLYGDPLFAQTGFGDEGDYHLQANSPAKNAGKVDLR